MGETFDKWVPCRRKMLGSYASCLVKFTGPLSCQGTGADIPCPSAAAAASGSASGFLSHCCPGLQILRFLPKKQSERTQRRVMKDTNQERRKEVSRFWNAISSCVPRWPSGCVVAVLGALLQTSLCKWWSAIILPYPPPL